MSPLTRFLGALLALLLGGLTTHARKRSQHHRNRKHRYDD